jgi:hypothetical protein
MQPPPGLWHRALGVKHVEVQCFDGLLNDRKHAKSEEGHSGKALARCHWLSMGGLGADFGYGPKPKLSETETPKHRNPISSETPVYP